MTMCIPSKTVEGGEYIAKELNIEEFDFAWEGKSVSEDEYYENLHAVYDIDKNQNVEPEQYERLDEMLFHLHMGTALSQTHRYELYVGDATWDEAKRRCEEKGGYLATITAIEEYERIKKGIEGSGQTQIAYWVGDYYGLAVEEKIDETGIYLLYDDVTEDCLYDAPMDMLLPNPEYTGKIGYICEYDSVTVMAKENWFYPSDGSLACWYEYEYDNAGNRIKEACYNVDDGIYERKEYEYDNAVKLTKETFQRGADGEIYWYEYEYDSKGRQTGLSYSLSGIKESSSL